MFKAIAYKTFGGPEVLEWIDIGNPKPAAGEVRVRVKAAGVNPADWKFRQGYAQSFLPIQLPKIPGNEFAGVIDQLGEGATRFAVGDEVFGFTELPRFSAYAEVVIVKEEQLLAKPGSMSWEVAASLSSAGQTAFHALKALKIAPGETVLIHAAAGGVGTIAVQVARDWGARVIGTASPRNHDYLRELGAIPVAYGDGLVERVQALAPEGIAAALDGAGPEAIHASLKLVRDPMRIVTVVEINAGKKYGIGEIQTIGQRGLDALEELARLQMAGKLDLHISRRFPLGQAADAQREIAAGHVRGKIVLMVD